MYKQSLSVEKLVFSTIDEALDELNAVDRGRYYLCTCPECKKNEAFMYKNNMKFVQCNRENECGETTVLEFREKEKQVNVRERNLEESYPELSKVQIQSLDWINRALKHMKCYESPTFKNGYRGISEGVLEDFIADFQDESIVGKFFSKMKPLIDKDYTKNSWMKKRNLVIPVYGEDNSVERVLLRSSIDPDIQPKEIQLVVNPSKDARDFFVSIPEQSDTIVISEAIIDGMSFREVDSNVGLIALTGSRKTRGVKEYIRKNSHVFHGKKVILSMDDDVAGWKASQEVMKTLDDCQIDYQFFQHPKKINDPNQYLNDDYLGFIKSFDDVKVSFQSDQRDLVSINKDSDTVVICNSRLDGISFRTVDERIGLIALDINEVQKEWKLSEHIIQHQNDLKGKRIVLAFPNDEQGKKVETSVTKVLDSLNLDYQPFNYPLPNKFTNVKNPYEYSKINRKGFMKNIECFNLKKTVEKNTKIEMFMER